MSESAEALAANITSRRNVTIEIANITNTYCLLDPKVFLESGGCHSPPQPSVRPLQCQVCNFSKTSAAATGAVGVLTYDLFERHSNCAKEKVAIMFSVPYDNNTYKNWAAVGIFSRDQECNEELYKLMYYDKKQENFKREEANGCILTYEGRSLDVMCTMSPLGRAMMKVELWDKVFSDLSQKHY